MNKNELGPDLERPTGEDVTDHTSNSAWTPAFPLQWQDHCAALAICQRAAAESGSPVELATADPVLYRWIMAQLQAGQQGRLSYPQIMALDATGYPWRAAVLKNTSAPIRTELDERWDARYNELVAFHAEHGHCRPTFSASGNAPLSGWIKAQRENARSGQLHPDRLERLEALRWLADKSPPTVPGSGWGMEPAVNTNAAQADTPKASVGEGRAEPTEPTSEMMMEWEHYFAELCTKMQESGTPILSWAGVERSGLRGWVMRQRARCSLGTLDPALRERLDKVNFDWSGASPPRKRGRQVDRAGTGELNEVAQSQKKTRAEARWDTQIAQLKDFITTHGTTIVPVHYKGHPGLKTWLVDQRKRRILGYMTHAEYLELNALGIDWGKSALKVPPPEV